MCDLKAINLKLSPLLFSLETLKYICLHKYMYYSYNGHQGIKGMQEKNFCKGLFTQFCLVTTNCVLILFDDLAPMPLKEMLYVGRAC